MHYTPPNQTAGTFDLPITLRAADGVVFGRFNVNHVGWCIRGVSFLATDATGEKCGLSAPLGDRTLISRTPSGIYLREADGVDLHDVKIVSMGGKDDPMDIDEEGGYCN